MDDSFDETRLNELIGKVIGDVAGALSLYMAYLGDQAGIFTALDGAGRLTLEELAGKTGLNEKYLREWLGSVSAAGYVNFHVENETFSITPEQALVFTREGQPACMQGFFQLLVSQFEGHEKAVDNFKCGKGRPWGHHGRGLFWGTDRFFRPE